MKQADREFWDSRYRAGKTPWDFGGVPQALESYLAEAKPGRVLIPGCGLGHEIRTFHEHGWEVVAVDFSPAAIERARVYLGALASKIALADFFAHDFSRQAFDVIYERTFLCSQPPDRWPDYARRVHQLLADTGKLIGFFFYGHEDEGPPFPMTDAEAEALFGGRFTRLADEPVSDSLPLFAGRERWQVWQKHAPTR